jgi:hypothetical protein
VQAGEHVPAVLIGLTDLQALQRLLLPMPAQRRDRAPIQGDGACAAGGLRWADDHVPVVLLQLLGDGGDAAVEVQVAPA